MRISDWSSDVCSSDLPARADQHGCWPTSVSADESTARRDRRTGPCTASGQTSSTNASQTPRNGEGSPLSPHFGIFSVLGYSHGSYMGGMPPPRLLSLMTQIGSESCRERGCQYV